MCGSVVDIQSATAWLGEEKKKEEEEEEETTGRKYNVRICYAAGHKNKNISEEPLSWV